MSTTGNAPATCPATCTAGPARPGCWAPNFPEAVGGGGGDGADAVVICEELHQAGAPGGVFASLFTCGIAVPHIIASGDRAADRHVRAADAGRRARSARWPSPNPAAAPMSGTCAPRRSAMGTTTSSTAPRPTSPPGCAPTTSSPRCAPAGPARAGCRCWWSRKARRGFEVTRKLDKMGWRSSDTAELSYTDVRVPAANLVGAENSGFAQIAGPSSPSASRLPRRRIRVRSGAWTSPCSGAATGRRSAAR